MDDAQRMLIERACDRLVTEYCHLVDHGQAAKIADLFTEDGVWASTDNTMTGREQIARNFANRERNKARMSRHVCNNLLVDVIDENNARGVVYLTLYRHDGDEGRRFSSVGPPAMIGEYRDTFENTPNGWRFKRREISINFTQMKSAT
jgi:ketosteroid isomerase-like protein